MKTKKVLMNRFKVVALLIMSNEIYSILEDKLNFVAEAIDNDSDRSVDLIDLLINHCILINDSVSKLDNRLT